MLPRMAEKRGRAPATGRRTSCGVIVTDGALVLLGRFARRALWDIPKGVAEAGEEFAAAAARELREETGLVAWPDALRETITFAPEVAARGGQLLPSSPGAGHNHDGFFYALFRKR